MSIGHIGAVRKRPIGAISWGRPLAVCLRFRLRQSGGMVVQMGKAGKGGPRHAAAQQGISALWAERRDHRRYLTRHKASYVTRLSALRRLRDRLCYVSNGCQP